VYNRIMEGRPEHPLGMGKKKGRTGEVNSIMGRDERGECSLTKMNRTNVLFGGEGERQGAIGNSII